MLSLRVVNMVKISCNLNYITLYNSASSSHSVTVESHHLKLSGATKKLFETAGVQHSEGGVKLL